VARGSVALCALENLSPDAPSPQPQAEHARANVAPQPLALSEVGAKRFGPRTSLLAPAGSLVALVGPTGSGKSTLLRTLLGLEPATGSVQYGETELVGAGIGPDERPFAWVPQHAPLIDDTLVANVMLCGNTESEALDAHEQVGADRLLSLAHVAVGPSGRNLSGGERRLVAVARAVASGLPVLLLDEPSEGLDARAKQQMLAALSRLRPVRTLVVATHEPGVLEIADCVVEIGSSLELEPSPTDPLHSELSEEARVVFEQHPNIGNAVT
jgi:ABC-type transport system involved in cytochrome bd biosynthesis fused ATPase/permease subunit